MSTKIECQYTGCDYVAEHASEAVAIALFSSHNNVHQGPVSSFQVLAKQKIPKIDRPELKQDVTDEDWYMFEAEWCRFKRCTDIPVDDVADQLFQCCDRSLGRLLLKENPTIIEAGEDALMAAMKRMAVIRIATSVRRANLLATKQEHGQSFREYFANIRAAASTCQFKVKCPHTCCATKDSVDYTSLVVKDILIAGIADNEIRKDLLSWSELDNKSDKDIVAFIEEKEIAKNAYSGSLGTTAGMSSYHKSKREVDSDANAAIKNKLLMKGKCIKCKSDISLYKKYQSGRLNKEPFALCIACFKENKASESRRPIHDKNAATADKSESSAVSSFIGVLELSGHNFARPQSVNIVPTTEVGASSVTLMVDMPDLVDYDSDEEDYGGSLHECYSADNVNQVLDDEAGASLATVVMAIPDLVDYDSDDEEYEGSLLKCCDADDVDQVPEDEDKVSTLAHQDEDDKDKVLDDEDGQVIDDEDELSASMAQHVYDDHRHSADKDHALDTGNRGHTFSEHCGLEHIIRQSPGAPVVVLDHHIFTSSGWARASALSHPTLRVRIVTHPDDYNQLGFPYPKIAPKHIDVVADSGAQSCLWSRKEFYANGFSKSDLIPVRHSMKAANRVPITIDGAILLRLSGVCSDGHTMEAAVMVYISPEARSFFMSKEALVQLGIIPSTFPQIGAAINRSSTASLEGEDVSMTRSAERLKSPTINCGCQRRALPPGKPNKLPFPCTPENVGKMKQWLLDRYASSTFNQCPHQTLPNMIGPPIKLHVDPKAKPVNLRTPAPVPLHWQEKVEQDLNRDVDLGVLERVPYGEPTKWCFRMVISRKHDGGPRRTVDLSPLNKFCEREAHPSKSPFHLARSVPRGSVKTVLDAWNGFHSVPIVEEDCHFTTFTTPWGLFRYKRAPQGFLSSGDGYTRRFDDISAHIQRMVRCIDDTLLHDRKNLNKFYLEEHWWRVIEFLEVAGHGGVILNAEKFQFSEEVVDFAGFRIGNNAVEPLPKYLDAIREYPTPANITDVRSWFGLVNQVSHYSQLRDMMEPFRKFLSPKIKFEWTTELDELFEESKKSIIDAIQKGVQIFDPTKRTALRVDWSKTGIGFWLLQKHCQCKKRSPGCCEDGWRIVLAGSRFLSQAEQNYAPVEGEALSVAWSLEQTRYFTMGCNDLLVVVDHQPLVKLLGNRRLDEIENPRLFRLKQRTLMWRFEIEYQPGKNNHFADAVSRRPNKYAELASIALMSDIDLIEESMMASVAHDMDSFFAVTLEKVQLESRADRSITMLIDKINSGFPASKKDMPNDIANYWDFRQHLSVIADVVIYKDRIVIPSSLRMRVLENLHSAHQGVSCMLSRAQATVFWPGITADVENTRNSCRTCHRNAPSQPKMPPVEPTIPKVPFELIYADYFDLHAKHYLIVGDRLSGWTEVVQVQPGTATSGAKGLCKALRQVFVTFGVPVEISSDGGPEFVAGESADFFHRWGIRHRLSSAYFPQSNGRAELAVKATKRLLEDNVGLNGNLNTDKVVRGLLQQRNTPDRDCKLSPAEVLFGHPLRDSLPQLDKSMMVFENHHIHSQWHEAWAAKENAIRSRLVRSCETLESHSKELEPLREGDLVFVQNQDRSSKQPNKWDRQGTVVATGDYDQYLVRIAGTGRLTLRNRRFLRKFRERSQFIEPLNHIVPKERTIPSSAEQPIISEPIIPASSAVQTQSTPDKPLLESEIPEAITQSVPSLPTHNVVPTMSGDPALNETFSKDNNVPLRRSTREIKQRLLYDASTGTYQ